MDDVWIRRRAVDAVRGLPVAVLSLAANIPLFVLSVLCLGLAPLGVGVLALPTVTGLVRDLAGLHRRLAGRAGVPVPTPYRPAPAGHAPWRRFGWIVTDPATWRDLLWLLAGIPVGFVLGLLPVALLAYGVEGVLVAPLLWRVVDGYGYAMIWPIDSTTDATLAAGTGALVLCGALAVAPWFPRAHAAFTGSLLAPVRAVALDARVQDLTDSRADAVDAQAAELRRIERDLHDGAQARLVALGLHVGLAEELIGTDPRAARRLMAEARAASGQALTELRDLVRGIHPPVLAERGLCGAVRALALGLPVPVHVDADLPGRPQPPVESAAYFAVAEALANVARHSRAAGASVRVSHARGVLSMTVTDNGVGGADPAAGSGLRGIARRLAAFDGTLAVTSPPGGPTTVTMELPCALC